MAGGGVVPITEISRVLCETQRSPWSAHPVTPPTHARFRSRRTFTGPALALATASLAWLLASGVARAQDGGRPQPQAPTQPVPTNEPAPPGSAPAPAPAPGTPPS